MDDLPNNGRTDSSCYSKKELTYKEAFGKSATTAYVYNIDYITGKESLSEVLINELSATDALPDGW